MKKTLLTLVTSTLLFSCGVEPETKQPEPAQQEIKPDSLRYDYPPPFERKKPRKKLRKPHDWDFS